MNRAILLAGTLAASAMVVAAVSWRSPAPGDSPPERDVSEPVVVASPPNGPRAPAMAEPAATRRVFEGRSEPTSAAQPEAVPSSPPSTPDPAEEQQRRARVEKVRAEIAQQLESRRPAVVQRCFPEGGAGAPLGGLILQITVDAEGRELARGTQESRALSPEISTCLREAMAGAVAVEPPGEKTDVELYVSFP